MRIAHLADLHLGHSRYDARGAGGIKQRELDVYLTFAQACEKIAALRPDLVLLAGDVFDMVRPPVRAIDLLLAHLSRLVALRIPVVAIGGNHERPKETERGNPLLLARRVGVRAFASPETAIVGDCRIVCVPEGFPISAHVGSGEYAFNVLLLHGEAHGMPGFKHSKHPDAALTTDQMREWSYVALGHYHVHAQVGPTAYYSGAIDYTTTDVWSEARTGVPKGFIEYDLSAGALTFHPLDVRPHIDLPVIDASGMDTAALEMAIAEHAATAPDGAVVRQVVVECPKDLSHSLSEKAKRDIGARFLHAQRDFRPPSAMRRVGRPVDASGRRKTLEDLLVESIAARPSVEGVPKECLTSVALDYMAEAAMAEMRSTIIEESAA